VCTLDFFGYNAAGELQYQDRIDSGDPRKELLSNLVFGQLNQAAI